MDTPVPACAQPGQRLSGTRRRRWSGGWACALVCRVFRHRRVHLPDRWAALRATL